MKGIAPALLLFCLLVCWVLADMDRLATAPLTRRGESAVFRAVEYDPERVSLRVTFRNGAAYEYLGVAPEHAYRMLSGCGDGAFYNRHIRGQYACRRIGPGPAESAGGARP